MKKIIVFVFGIIVVTNLQAQILQTNEMNNNGSAKIRVVKNDIMYGQFVTDDLNQNSEITQEVIAMPASSNDIGMDLTNENEKENMSNVSTAIKDEVYIDPVKFNIFF